MYMEMIANDLMVNMVNVKPGESFPSGHAILSSKDITIIQLSVQHVWNVQGLKTDF